MLYEVITGGSRMVHAGFRLLGAEVGQQGNHDGPHGTQGEIGNAPVGAGNAVKGNPVSLVHSEAPKPVAQVFSA